MNEFKILGWATDKPELKESEKGTKYCNLIVGVKKDYKGKDGEDLIEDFKVTCFATLAEDICTKVKKGKNILVEGRLQQANFNKKDSNEIIYKSDLIGERITYTG